MTAGRPLRVAFAGDATRFAAWVPAGATGGGVVGGLRATFVDPRGLDPSAVAASLRGARPDVVVALGVADHDASPLRAAGVPVLGVVVATSEPARLYATGSPGAACDRLVALDALEALGGRLWRTIAPPVDDALFAPAAPTGRPPRIVFHGASTEHRERWLATAKHLHDVRHVAHGMTPDRLPDLLARTDVALVAHRGDRPGFDHRVALHLAAGHLVLAEPLGPRHGLEAGIDLLEIADPDALARAVGAIRAAPDLFRRIRVRGRLKAERFRASHVWSRVLDDFLRDCT